MSLMLDFLYDDARSMAELELDHLVLSFFVKTLEHPLDVSDMDCLQNDLRSMAGNFNEIITSFYSRTSARCL
jgi:hypothetical protein